MAPVIIPASVKVRSVHARRRWKRLFVCLCILAAAPVGLEVWAWYRIRHTAQADLWPSTRVSPAFLNATIAMEDGCFYAHGAFDWQAIANAVQVNFRRRRIVLGGSTITQQLAKNIYLKKERTLGRKFLEAFLALELERQWGKNRILERYVNEIDYGMGQHGIEAAAQFYFHTTPDRLTLAQSAVIVGMVPYAPAHWPNPALIELQRGKALDRIAFFFPNMYTQQEIDAARKPSLKTLLPGLPQ